MTYTFSNVSDTFSIANCFVKKSDLVKKVKLRASPPLDTSVKSTLLVDPVGQKPNTLNTDLV